MHLMRGFLKHSLLAGGVFALVWAAAIWYWRIHDSELDGADLMAVLVLLPLAILLAIWLRKYLPGRRAAAPLLVATQAPPVAQPPAQAAMPLVLVASALRVPHACDAQALAEALASNRRSTTLDPELVDDDGYPIRSARVDEAGDPGVQQAMRVWLAGNDLAMLDYTDEQWRALTLASAVTTELAQNLAAHAQKVAGTAPTLQLLLLWQADWQIAQRAAAAAWLRQLVASQGWPLEHILIDTEQAGIADDTTPSALLARLARQQSAGQPVLALAIACGSHIGEASVMRWAADNSLLTSAQWQGKIPGEGAAGLLLADRAQAALLGKAALVLLHSAESQRDKSIDDERRADAGVLRGLAELVLADSATDAQAVALVVADTGTRSNRIMETMSLADSLLPQLDSSEELLQTGVASGTCGAVPFVAVLALAAHRSAALDAPVLCLSNEDPVRRCAALLWPAPVVA